MRLAEYLESRNISRSEFADMIGISKAAVSNYVNGLRLPNLLTTMAILHATKEKVKIGDLIETWLELNDPHGFKTDPDALGSIKDREKRPLQSKRKR